MTSINFYKMIQHIKMYAGKECRNPDELQGEDKDRSLEIHRSGKEAIDNLNKLADYFEKYELKNKNNSRWLYASGKKAREKIWNQLKNEEHEEFPTSVTLLIQEREQVELCIVLDYYARNPKLTVLQQHHQFLDIDLQTDSHFFYRVTPKNSREKIISDENLDEVKKKLKDDEYELIELIYILKEEEIVAGNWSDLEILKVVDTAFSKIMRAYNSIINNTTTVEEIASTVLEKNVDQTLRTQLYREKNMILYGPPGTGKTYHTILYAVSIIETKTLDQLMNENYSEVKKRFDLYKVKNQIAFTTFHQSYGYEEFIEGIKPTVDEDGQIKYAIEQGVFKEFCELAGKSQLIQEGSEIEIKDSSSKLQVNLNEKPYVFIIDEINRGNISKILGELITLLETSKRLGENEELTVSLPYSKKEFGVPKNVYVIGTMNTADRSIALMDTALRRRFEFIEQLPDENKLENYIIGNINLKNMLKVMNQRIEVLYDREHTIGHAYFMELQNNDSIHHLKKIFENKIIPLLQEYFYEDFSKIQLIFNDSVKDEQYQIIQKQSLPHGLFSKNDLDLSDDRYKINLKALEHQESYIQIYGSIDG